MQEKFLQPTTFSKSERKIDIEVFLFVHHYFCNLKYINKTTETE